MDDEVVWRPRTPEAQPGGRWVQSEKLHSAVNVAYRAFRTSGGKEGVFLVTHSNLLLNIGETVEWYFPPALDALTRIPQVRHVPLRLRLLLGM